MNKVSTYGAILLVMAGCAHQTPFPPSQGHIGTDQEPAKPVVAGDIPKPVKKATYLPPPKPKAKEQTYSVVVNDVPVREILFALARESKTNIDIHPGINGNVTINAVDQTLPAILERISKQIDLRYKLEGNTLSIMPDIPTLRTYKVNYVNMDRDTTSTIGVAAQIASTGQAASTGTTSTSSTPTSVASANSSNTRVDSKSKNNFWELLTENIRTILRTTKTQAAVAQETNALLSSAQNALDKTAQSLEGKEGAAAKQAKEDRDALLKLVKEQAQASATKDEVIVNSVAGTVTVMATERQHNFIQQYIDTVMASVQRQVLIETTIVEVALSDQFQTGIDWSRLGSKGGNKGFTFTQTLGGAALATGNQFVIGYSNTASKLGDLTASIRLLETFGNARVLSSPKLMAINNQTAILKVVDNLVYFTIKADTTTPSTGPAVTTYTTTPQTVPVGVVMSVTPQVNENGTVTLNIRPTISRRVGDTLDPNPDLKKVGVESKVPQIQVREMESVLQVNSGQSVVLGGLMQDDISKSMDAVPGVSKVPLIGKLFQGKNDRTTKTELVIFLKPTVISNPSLDSEALSQFRQYLPDQLPAATTDELVN